MLVIDDNIDAADTFGWLLEAIHHTVQVTYSANAGLDLSIQFRPHVIFCDLGMPEMSGYEFARAFRNREGPRTTATTLIAVSGWTDEQTRIRTKVAGFDAYLLKPATFAAIQLLLDEHCVKAIEPLGAS